MHRIGLNKTALISEIPYIINDEKVKLHQCKGKNQFQF